MLDVFVRRSLEYSPELNVFVLDKKKRWWIYNDTLKSVARRVVRLVSFRRIKFGLNIINY